MDKYYPIMLDVCEKKCIVIGGGKVAERKVISLLTCGAKVKVISLKHTNRLKELQLEKKIELIERSYTVGDIKGNFLAFIATNQGKVNEICIEEARNEGVLVNVIDNPCECDFVVPSVIRRGDLQVTISTNGKSPMLSKKIREELEEIFGEEYTEFISALGDLRKIALKEIDDIHIRRNIFKRIVYSDLLKRYKDGEIKDIQKSVMKLYQNMIKDIDIL
ncbi:precorrin-2 dehydrogenase/sirohydrochlorin ferrochelatase family protein [Crassaminicella profunda]|uniref:precorrin-2 dehydrogenase/sirohydrochlorin ferrochelatase family protein n=1 Tax=Crassaminicella profunda TaxID=1286698 RepID=UPI001CA638E1|nr:bifunctional precorrin-2 dehydrogenase/sirohydrochlorin ferrochelatase [Crassaminicella profunda]QZY57359.1 bifunctional precorrin-2 dehydrogenase/sirohydrochlorin ferrochelatase [Crassaminicella profunda]